MSVTSIQFGPVNGEMLTLARPDGSPLEGYFGASVGDWGIASSNGALYFDTSGATVGEQAVVGIDPAGHAFLEPAVEAERNPDYVTLETLSIMRESRESVTKTVSDGALLEQQAAREIREDFSGPVDSSVPARSSDGGREDRQSVGAVPDSSDLRAQAAAAREARQRPVPPRDRSEVDAALRAMRDLREDSTEEAAR